MDRWWRWDIKVILCCPFSNYDFWLPFWYLQTFQWILYSYHVLFICVCLRTVAQTRLVYMSNKRQELLTLREHLCLPPVFVESVLLIFFSYLCCVVSFFLYFILLLCLFYSSFLCTQCCQCLWIIHSWLPLRFSLTCMS